MVSSRKSILVARSTKFARCRSSSGCYTVKGPVTMSLVSIILVFATSRPRLDRSFPTESDASVPYRNSSLACDGPRSHCIVAMLGRGSREKEGIMMVVSFGRQALAKRWPPAPLHPSSCASGPLETPYHHHDYCFT